MNKKRCNRCKEIKSINNFSKSSNLKSGYRGTCKKCDHITRILWDKNNVLVNREYGRKQAFKANNYLLFFIRRMYNYMQARVRGQGSKSYLYVGLDICSRKDFIKFAMRSWQLRILFANWIYFNRKKKLMPTPDRIDESKGYTLDNVQFLTFSDNVKKQFISGRRTKI